MRILKLGTESSSRFIYANQSFIDIKKFFQIYSDRSGDFYSGVIILYKFRYQKNGLLNKEKIQKMSVFVAYIVCAVQQIL